MTIKLGVLASGRGSNFAAIQTAIDAGTLAAQAVILLSDQPGAKALGLAEAHGIPSAYIPYDRTNRASFEQAAAEKLEAAGCDLIILAGFMRLITPAFIHQFEGRILNIHPSLLPSFKGLHAQRQALEYGVKFAGCTVHVVTEEMDAGPIIGQRVVPVFESDTEDTLSARILEQEHQLYPEAIATYARLHR